MGSTCCWPTLLEHWTHLQCGSKPRIIEKKEKKPSKVIFLPFAAISCK